MSNKKKSTVVVGKNKRSSKWKLPSLVLFVALVVSLVGYYGYQHWHVNKLLAHAGSDQLIGKVSDGSSGAGKVKLYACKELYTGPFGTTDVSIQALFVKTKPSDLNPYVQVYLYNNPAPAPKSTAPIVTSGAGVASSGGGNSFYLNQVALYSASGVPWQSSDIFNMSVYSPFGWSIYIGGYKNQSVVGLANC